MTSLVAARFFVRLFGRDVRVPSRRWQKGLARIHFLLFGWSTTYTDWPDE